MQVSEIIKVIAPDTFERPIYAGNAIQTVQVEGRQEGHHGADLDLCRRRRGRQRIDRDSRCRGRSRPLHLPRRGGRQERSSRTDVGADHRLRRPRHAEPREFREIYRAARRPARRRCRRLARGGRCRLCAERLAGGPDRQGGCARTLCRDRYFRGDPASRRHEGFQGDRCDQQGRGRPDLPGRRLRPGRRSLSGGS